VDGKRYFFGWGRITFDFFPEVIFQTLSSFSQGRVYRDVYFL